MPASRPRLELVWPGKDQFLLTPTGEDGKPVWVEPDHPAAHEVRLTEFTGAYGEVNDADPYADNLVFTGDSLDVLRVLCEVPEYRRQYRGRVKLIYIDPPFNTGQTFEHYDDWMEHSTWLSFMRDRLLLMKELLAPDGIIWVHLDDAEVHRMRCLMDEVFGPHSFLATVIWEKADSPRMDAKGFSLRHDALLVYSASGQTHIRREALSLGQQSHFGLTDEAGRKYRLVLFRKTGANALRSDRPKMWYAITAPDGTDVYPVTDNGVEGRWRWGEDTFSDRANEVEWVVREGKWVPYLRQYAKEAATQPPETLWRGEETGYNRTAKAEMKAMGLEAFSTPKPEGLIKRLIHISTGPGDLILDCFAGSGTTAAVAQKMGRRWVTGELSPDTVAKFIVPRLMKVVDGADPGGITKDVGWEGGGGFRTVTVGPSMFYGRPTTVQPDSSSVSAQSTSIATATVLSFDSATSTRETRSAGSA